MALVGTQDENHPVVGNPGDQVHDLAMSARRENSVLLKSGAYPDPRAVQGAGDSYPEVEIPFS